MRFKRKLVFWLALTFALLPIDSPTIAEEGSLPMVSAGVETETNSRYLWHGLVCSEGAVQQSTFWASMANIAASLWINHDLKTRSFGRALNEIDLSLTYYASLKNLALESSLTYYVYPHQSESPETAEVGLAVGYPVGPVEAFTNHTLDIKEYKRAYYGEVGLAYTAEPTANMSLELALACGWASSQFTIAYAGAAPAPFRVLSLSASLYYRPSAWLYLRPHIAHFSILSQSYDTVISDLDHWQLGLAVGSEF